MAKGPTFSTITAAFASASKLNANFTNVNTAFNNTISRDGSTPNAMGADLDLDSNNIVNVNSLDVDTFILDGTAVTAGVLPAASVEAHDFDTKVIAAATNIDTDSNFIRTAGFSTVGDGGGGLYKAVDNEPSHAFKVQSNDGQWWELISDAGGLVAKQVGAKGNDSTDDATALNSWLAAGSLSTSLVLSQGIYLTGSTLTGTDNPSLLAGAGWQVANDNSISGTVLKASGTGVADVLVIQSTTPASQGSTNVEGVALRDFAIFHRGTGDGLLIDNVIRAFVTNVHIDCNNEGAVGLHTKNFGFFSTFEKLYIDRFVTTGLKLGGLGSQHVVRDCHIQSSNSAAVAAIEVIRDDFLIDGGQYNVNLAGNTGIGILVNNTDVVKRNGGRIMHTICETDIAVKITGTTQRFRNVVVAFNDWDLNAVTKGIIFDRAENCTLLDPQITNPTSGGTLAEWTANSIDSGVICNAHAATAALIVNGSATRPWMQVTGFLDITARDLITTATNLTVLVDNVKRLGTTRHNGVAWDKEFILVNDNAVVSFTPPAATGTVEVHTDTEVDEYILAQFKTTSTAKMGSLVVGAKSAVILTDGTLTGSTGVDGDLTVRADSASGKIYFENQTGAAKFLFITFTQSV